MDKINSLTGMPDLIGQKSNESNSSNKFSNFSFWSFLDKDVNSKIEEIKLKRKQKDVLTELAEQKERLKIAKVEAFRGKKLIMNRLGKTVELIVKLENNLYDEGKDDQKVKIRDQLETRGLEAARDHEMLELEGTPQDIVDFRRKFVPALIFHACPIG